MEGKGQEPWKENQHMSKRNFIFRFMTNGENPSYAKREIGSPRTTS